MGSVGRRLHPPAGAGAAGRVPPSGRPTPTRFDREMPQSQIGEELGVSRMQISRLLSMP
ncbi:sigma factor-like helix-turn-helix DNA-binding protein [Streptomyces sp. NBC_01465]|uniref:sigma factor-like helix-turn-helix DNA-binding protein n=1 Tax=Streptomyces sp. NBC_01465 TaxID=2903878 RepID=UPI002E3233E2|nr:sigma factor-like helix-turn-helix DNA-binding protein [Streptomyces sp. NBC_01465]